MLTRLSQTIEKIATLRNALLLLLSLLPFVFVFFPWRSNTMEAIVGYPLRPLDVRWPYIVSDVRTLANDLGESGRRMYALTEVTLDFAFPVLYSTLASVIVVLVWRKARPDWTRWRWLILLPYFGMLADFAENVCIAILMFLFPNLPIWLMWLSNMASFLKWSAGLVSLGAIILGLSLSIFNRIR